jgi:hypothetical protein
MTTPTVTVQIPEALYRRLERLAHLMARPVDSLIVQTLTASLPPLPDDLSAITPELQAAIEASWERNQAAYRHLGGGQRTEHPLPDSR